MILNLANQITLSRLVLAGIFFGVISMFDASTGQPQGHLLWIAFGLYILACISDIIDGEIARRHSGITTFGRVIDPFVDKVLVVGTYVFFASNHFAVSGRSITGVQAWMVVIILIRELLVTDLRMISESQGSTFGATFYGKLKMVVQSAAILWILLSLVIGGLTTTGPWYYSRQAAAVTAVLVTFLSLAAYIRRANFLLAEALTDLRKLLLTGFGTGFLPIAPGTWGSLAAAALWLAGAVLLNPSGHDPWRLVIATAVAIAAASAICVAFGPYAIDLWKKKDPGCVVIDEFAGQWVSLLPVAFVPPGRMQVIGAIIAFFCFRVFDVIKPPPARQAESLPAGVGILTDDLFAGVYAALATWAALYLLNRP